MSTTYVVVYKRRGRRTESAEVWADSVNDAKNKLTAAYPDAVVSSVKIRRAF